MNPIRLLIVDDHPVVRDGLRGMFTRDPQFTVAGEAATGMEAVALRLFNVYGPGQKPTAYYTSVINHFVKRHATEQLKAWFAEEVPATA